MGMCVDHRRGLSDHLGTKGLPYPYCYSWKVPQSASTTSASISTIALEPFPVTNKGQIDILKTFKRTIYKFNLTDYFYKFCERHVSSILCKLRKLISTFLYFNFGRLEYKLF